MYGVDKFSPIVGTRGPTNLENWVVFSIVLVSFINY